MAQRKPSSPQLSMTKKALITGITGQDGSYLAELLLKKGYEVHGVIRRASTFNTGRIDHLYQDPHINGVHLFLHFGDLADANTIRKLLYKVSPDEIYAVAAGHGPTSAKARRARAYGRHFFSVGEADQHRVSVVG